MHKPIAKNISIAITTKNRTRNACCMFTECNVLRCTVYNVRKVLNFIFGKPKYYKFCGAFVLFIYFVFDFIFAFLAMTCPKKKRTMIIHIYILKPSQSSHLFLHESQNKLLSFNHMSNESANRCTAQYTCITNIHAHRENE